MKITLPAALRNPTTPHLAINFLLSIPKSFAGIYISLGRAGGRSVDSDICPPYDKSRAGLLNLGTVIFGAG